MKKKLGSRKFLITLAGVLTVIINDYFGIGLSGDSVFAIVTLVAGYVLGQGYVDGKKKEEGQ